MQGKATCATCQARVVKCGSPCVAALACIRSAGKYLPLADDRGLNVATTGAISNDIVYFEGVGNVTSRFL